MLPNFCIDTSDLSGYVSYILKYLFLDLVLLGMKVNVQGGAEVRGGHVNLDTSDLGKSFAFLLERLCKDDRLCLV